MSKKNTNGQQSYVMQDRIDKLETALGKAIGHLVGYAEADDECWTNQDGEFLDEDSRRMSEEAWLDIQNLRNVIENKFV